MRGNEYHEYIFLKITSIKPRNDQNTTGVYPGHVLKHCVALAIKQGNTGSAPINFTCQSAMSSFFFSHNNDNRNHKKNLLSMSIQLLQPEIRMKNNK